MFIKKEPKDCRRSGEFHCVGIIYLLMNATNGKKKNFFIFLSFCVADIVYNDQFTYLTFSKFNSSAFRYQYLSHFVQRSRLRMSLSWYWIGFQEDLWLIKRNLNWNSWSVCEYLNSIHTNKHIITRVGTLIVATIYLQLIQNRHMFRSFTVLQCSHQHCVQPVASDVEVVGYL